MAAKKTTKPKICNCVAQANKGLERYNGEVDVAHFIIQGISLPKIAVVKKDDKIRQKPPVLTPNFCPFCGKEYPKIS